MNSLLVILITGVGRLRRNSSNITVDKIVEHQVVPSGMWLEFALRNLQQAHVI
jgi:hypothetical protein